MEPIRRPTQPLQRRGAPLGDIQGPRLNLAHPPVQPNPNSPASAPAIPVNDITPAVPQTAPVPAPTPPRPQQPPVVVTPAQVENIAPAPVVIQSPTVQTEATLVPEQPTADKSVNPESNLPSLTPKLPDRPYAQPIPNHRVPMVAVVAIIVSTGLAGLTLFSYFNMESANLQSSGTSESQREPVTQGDIDDAINGTIKDLQELPASDYSPEGLADSTLGL